LDVSLPYFFQEMSAEIAQQTPSMLMNAKKLPAIDDEKDPMVRRETLELVRAYYRIPDPAVRKRDQGDSQGIGITTVETPPAGRGECSPFRLRAFAIDSSDHVAVNPDLYRLGMGLPP
jgi:hypothetical protein